MELPGFPKIDDVAVLVPPNALEVPKETVVVGVPKDWVVLCPNCGTPFPNGEELVVVGVPNAGIVVELVPNGALLAPKMGPVVEPKEPLLELNPPEEAVGVVEETAPKTGPLFGPKAALEDPKPLDVAEVVAVTAIAPEPKVGPAFEPKPPVDPKPPEELEVVVVEPKVGAVLEPKDPVDPNPLDEVAVVELTAPKVGVDVNPLAELVVLAAAPKLGTVFDPNGAEDEPKPPEEVLTITKPLDGVVVVVTGAAVPKAAEDVGGTPKPVPDVTGPEVFGEPKEKTGVLDVGTPNDGTEAVALLVTEVLLPKDGAAVVLPAANVTVLL